MKKRTIILIIFALILGVTAWAEPADPEKVKWQKGPAIGNLNNIAEIRVPAGYAFVGPKDTKVLMEAMQNPLSDEEVGLIAPEGLDWFVVFEYEKVGYIRDDEKSSLDAAAMLESIKKGTEEGNKERRRRGWATMTITGWEQEPRYNETTHNLEWAIRGESEGEPVINYNTRILGRAGVMRVTLVTDPETLAPTLPLFKNLLAGFDFKPGKRYAEYRRGDKLAKYGLSALVVGGASAVAVKSGLFKYLWKIIVVGFLALMSFFKRFFKGKKAE